MFQLKERPQVAGPRLDFPALFAQPIKVSLKRWAGRSRKAACRYVFSEVWGLKTAVDAQHDIPRLSRCGENHFEQGVLSRAVPLHGSVDDFIESLCEGGENAPQRR